VAGELSNYILMAKLIVVVWVLPPPEPVTVMEYVPGLAPVPTLIDISVKSRLVKYDRLARLPDVRGASRFFSTGRFFRGVL
jgi:hypothetical protein